jgi:hypothetical protein
MNSSLPISTARIRGVCVGSLLNSLSSSLKRSCSYKKEKVVTPLFNSKNDSVINLVETTDTWMGSLTHSLQESRNYDVESSQQSQRL